MVACVDILLDIDHISIMQILILGNGGCLNVGLPHNAFLIDSGFLVELPPDIMLSMQALHIDVSSVHTIYISHLHGDHTFGFPFYIINAWIQAMRASQPRRRRQRSSSP